MATHQGKITPWSGAGQEVSIPLKCITCGNTQVNVTGKSLGLTSFEPTEGEKRHSLGHTLPEMKREQLIMISIYSIEK